MGVDIPSQFIEIDGKPVIVYTLEVFENNPDINTISGSAESYIDKVWEYAKNIIFLNLSGY